MNTASSAWITGGLLLLNIENLKQLVAFADCGTLSAAAAKCNISQPTITRNMQAVEEDFGVPLFDRSKNRISLNDTGRLAVEHARNILAACDSAYQIVRTYDKSIRTISIKSCAPAPLWSLLPRLSNSFPDMSISSEIVGDSSRIIDEVIEGICNIGVALYPPEDTLNLFSHKYMDEKLFICLPVGHELVQSKKTAVTFEDLNGYNCLLRSQLGFWSELVYRKMPSSKFLVQADDYAMEELIRTSTLPFFVTDVSLNENNISKDRCILPIEDDEAGASYYLISKEKTFILK